MHLRLQGACSGCPHAQMTIKSGIERMLREGRRVRCLVRDARQLPSHPNVEAVVGSIDDAAAVERAAIK